MRPMSTAGFVDTGYAEGSDMVGVLTEDPHGPGQGVQGVRTHSRSSGEDHQSDNTDHHRWSAHRSRSCLSQSDKTLIIH